MRIGNKLLGRQLGPIEICASNTDAADIQLALYAYRNRLQFRIKDVRVYVRERPSDRDVSSLPVALTTPFGRGDRRFRRSVRMVKLRSQILEELLHRFDRQGLAAANHLSQRGAIAGFQLLQERPKHRWNKIGSSNLLRVDRIHQISCVQVAARRHDDHGGAGG